jgi:glycosyltransferase involved in cell wall biosynthesis
VGCSGKNGALYKADALKTDMDILIMTPGFPADENDTTCIPFLQDFVRGLQDKIGPESIRIISFQYPYAKGQYAWHGSDVFSAGGKNKKGIAKWLTWRLVQQQADKWITPNTVIHSFWLSEAAEIGARLAGKHKLRHISTIMGQDVLLTNRYLQRLHLPTIQVVAPNEKAAGYFHIHTARDVAAIIPHAIAPIPIVHTNRDIDLLFVGSFIELKQPELFVEVVAACLEQLLGIKAEMIGEGPLLSQIRSLVQEKGLPIHIQGKLDRYQVHENMNRTNILLHTSRYEGHSTVISEALACGCRVVCFDVGHATHDAVQVVTDFDTMRKVVCDMLQTEPPAIFRPINQQKEAIDQYIALYNT